MKTIAKLAVAYLMLVVAASLAMAAADDEFYRGKTISLIIPIGPGGAYDTYARLVARHLPNFIPGHPVIVPRNMPGGGGALATNYVYNIAPRDGTTLIIITSTFAVEQLLGNVEIKYDARNFRGIGRLFDTTSILAYWHASPVQTAADLVSKPSIAAVAAVNEIFSVRLLVMNRLLGTQIKLVPGYPSGSDKVLAVERGEADGFWMPYITLSQLYSSYLTEKKINIIMQSAVTRNSSMPEVPTMLELAKDQETRQIFRYLVSNDQIGRSLFTTPDIPAEQLAQLRSAFRQMLADPDFRADAEKVDLPLEPASGEELESIVRATFDVPPTALEKVKDLMKP